MYNLFDDMINAQLQIIDERDQKKKKENAQMEDLQKNIISLHKKMDVIFDALMELHELVTCDEECSCDGCCGECTCDEQQCEHETSPAPEEVNEPVVHVDVKELQKYIDKCVDDRIAIEKIAINSQLKAMSEQFVNLIVENNDLKKLVSELEEKLNTTISQLNTLGDEVDEYHIDVLSLKSELNKKKTVSKKRVE